jgi:hypothetical protein
MVVDGAVCASSSSPVHDVLARDAPLALLAIAAAYAMMPVLRQLRAEERRALDAGAALDAAAEARVASRVGTRVAWAVRDTAAVFTGRPIVARITGAMTGPKTALEALAARKARQHPETAAWRSEEGSALVARAKAAVAQFWDDVARDGDAYLALKFVWEGAGDELRAAVRALPGAAGFGAAQAALQRAFMFVQERAWDASAMQLVMRGGVGALMAGACMGAG